MKRADCNDADEEVPGAPSAKAVRHESEHGSLTGRDSGEVGTVSASFLDAPLSDAAKDDAADAEAAFKKVWKNRIACLSTLCQHAQRIERVWEADKELRRALLASFSSCLASLSTHKDNTLQELSSLAPKISPSATLKHFLTIALPIERQHTRGLRDHEFLVLRPDDTSRADVGCAGAHAVADQASVGERSRMPLIVVMDNLRSSFNVGSIFRTSESLRVQKLHLCGYTATPNETKSQTGRAAMGADANVPWDHRQKSYELVQELRDQGVPVIAVETVAGAASVHEFPFPSPCALLLGNERHGLEADLLALCSATVRIPCHGVKNSLNVGVAFAVVAFEVARQWRWDGGRIALEGAQDTGDGGAASSGEAGAAVT